MHIVDRAKNIIITPKTEWDVIANAIRRRIAAAYGDRETILSVWDEVRPGGEGAESPARRRKQ